MVSTSNALISLGDHIDLLSGFAFKSKFFTQEVSDIPLVKGSNVHQGYVDWVGAVRWPIHEHSIKDKYWLQENDVVLAMDRPWIESGLKFSWIKKNDPKSLLVQRVCRMRGIKGLCSRYLRYIIGSPQFTNYIKPIVTGVNVPHISGQQVKDFKFTLPPAETQLAVSDLLENYDSLIENNKRRIAILEDMAQSLYREWFVNFRYPGHADALDAFLPNALNENQANPKLIDSPLGPIPEGWEIGKLESMSSMKYGKMSKKELRCEEGIPIYSGYKITGYYPEANLNESKVIVVARGVGGTGDVKMSPDICWLTNLSIYIMENENILKKAYLFYQLKFANLRSLDSGTSISQITIADLSKFKIIVPPIAIQEKFEGICNTFWSQIKILTKQNENLKQQRDMLLPKLISGKIEL
jgi:type I restriction enzyme S subunit